MAKMKKGVRFDLDDYEMKDSSALPAGQYLAAITASEWKPASSGQGTYLSLEFTVLKGDFKGRKFWNNLNLVHENEQAVEIAKEHFSGIHKALGFDKIVDDTEQLHKKPMVVTLRVKKDDKGEKNTIAKYESGKGSKAGKGKEKGEDAPPWETEGKEKKKDKKKDKVKDQDPPAETEKKKKKDKGIPPPSEPAGMKKDKAGKKKKKKDEDVPF